MFKDEPAKAKQVSLRLTAEYKRHSYVIDRQEARQTLQLNVKDASSASCTAMWQLHHLYDRLMRGPNPQRLPRERDLAFGA
jgi:hypothetical protein